MPGLNWWRWVQNVCYSRCSFLLSFLYTYVHSSFSCCSIFSTVRFHCSLWTERLRNIVHCCNTIPHSGQVYLGTWWILVQEQNIQVFLLCVIKSCLHSRRHPINTRTLWWNAIKITFCYTVNVVVISFVDKKNFSFCFNFFPFIRSHKIQK